MSQDLVSYISNKTIRHQQDDFLIEGNLKDDPRFSDLADVYTEHIIKLLNKNPVFSMIQLREKFYKDERTTDKIFANYVFQELSNNYSEYNSELGNIVYIGDPRLGIYTTESRLNEELELIKLLTTHNDGYFNTFQLPEENIDETIRRDLLISDQQKNAVWKATHTKSYVSVIEGYAGAGKSRTMSLITSLYKQFDFALKGIALSNMAAQVLQAETKINCVSVERFLKQCEKKIEDGKDPFDEKTLLVVDEGGLIGVKQMLRIFKYVKASKFAIKVIIGGDTTQLNPINEANALEIISKVINPDAHATITEIRRQRAISHRNVVKLLKDGHSGKGLNLFNNQEMIEICDNLEDLKERVLVDFFSNIKHNQNETNLIVCYDNQTIYDINRRARNILINMGRVDKNQEITLSIERKINAREKEIASVDFAVGDMIMFNKNDNRNQFDLIDSETKEVLEDRISNRMMGRIEKIVGKQNSYEITVSIEMANNKKALVKIDTKQYSDNNCCAIDLCYAVSIYSSQGQTVDRTYIIDSPYFNRRVAYVASSRHRVGTKIYINKQQVIQSLLKNFIASNKKKNVEALNEEGINNPNVDRYVQSITNVDILNHVSKIWGQRQDQTSIIVSFIQMMDKLKELGIKKTMPTNLEDYITKMRKIQSVEENKKTRLQTVDDLDIIFDSPDFFVSKPNEIDLYRLREIENKAFNPNTKDVKAIYNEIPVIEKEKYQISDVLDENLFLSLHDKYFEIGRGGTLRIISKIDNITISTFDIYGNDTKGIGYPCIISGGNSSKDVFIIEDLNDFFEYIDKFYIQNEDKTFSPTLIWGAKDNNYSLILNCLNSTNIYLLGTREFKDITFANIVEAIPDYQLKATFSNITKQYVLDNLSDKIVDKSLEKLKFEERKHEFNIDNSSTQSLEIDYSLENNTNENKNKTENEILNIKEFKPSKVVDMYGNINNDILVEIIKSKRYLDDKTIEEYVLPRRKTYFDHDFSEEVQQEFSNENKNEQTKINTNGLSFNP